MPSFEEQFQKACEDRYIPGAVLICGNSKGEILYQKAFGYRSLKGDPLQPLSPDDCFVLASCTKLITSVAALQCVDRGQIGLDDDLSDIIPEFKDIEVITGFDESQEPILKKAVNKITLRALLTHTSGFTYPGGNPRLVQWSKSKAANGWPKSNSLVDQITVPLLFEPGTSWEYGVGHDWAGVLVSRLNDNVTLQSYMEKNIWHPLGITLLTFHPDEHPEVKRRLVGMSKRGTAKRIAREPTYNSDEKVEYTDETFFKYPMADEWGGAGVIAAPTDYVKILLSLLVNDEKLLSSAMVDQMFTPQIGPDAVKAFEAWMDRSRGNFTDVPAGTPLQWGLGSRLIMGDLETTGLRKGTLQWAGLTNLMWSIDRAAGLCMFYASNLIPFGDAKMQEYQQLFEKEMYNRFG
ncbi:beta-lactamase/transpeptidase-like protein [Xylogone sp. PMI_703]|nr:beta-lactamase/transpeptidase-like protein [Xylogone sp. PMI_703]